MTETLANGYSYESTRRELSNEYKHDRASMVFEKIVLCMKVASALEGLNPTWAFCSMEISILHCNGKTLKMPNILVLCTCLLYLSCVFVLSICLVYLS